MPVSADCYLLCIMVVLETEIIYFFNLNGQHKFSFWSYICKLGKHAGSDNRSIVRRRSVIALSVHLYSIQFLGSSFV